MQIHFFHVLSSAYLVWLVGPYFNRVFVVSYCIMIRRMFRNAFGLLKITASSYVVRVDFIYHAHPLQSSPGVILGLPPKVQNLSCVLHNPVIPILSGEIVKCPQTQPPSVN